MTSKKSKVLIRSGKSILTVLNKKIISAKPNESISNRRKLYIHIISKKPFTIDGLKFFLVNHIPAGYEFIFTGCADKCESRLDIAQCQQCNVSVALKNLDFHLMKLPDGQASQKTCPDILLIDDYGFLDNTYRAVGNYPYGKSTKEEDNTFFKSLYQSIYKTSIEKNIKTILVTGNNNALYLKYHINFGVSGIVHITSAKENVLKAIVVVSKGGNYIDAFINNLISKYQKYLNNQSISKLSNRQLEVLLEISNSLKNHQIAPKLNISVNAVEKHKLNIQAILNLSSDEIGQYAIKNKSEILYFMEFSIRRIESTVKRSFR